MIRDSGCVANAGIAAYSSARGRAMAARQLNPLEVGGSIPLPATHCALVAVCNSIVNKGVPGSRDYRFSSHAERLQPLRPGVTYVCRGISSVTPDFALTDDAEMAPCARAECMVVLWFLEACLALSLD